jgi:hypothetical protein
MFMSVIVDVGVFDRSQGQNDIHFTLPFTVVICIVLQTWVNSNIAVDDHVYSIYITHQSSIIISTVIQVTS